MRARVWKTDVWHWQVRKPGLTVGGPAPSWRHALAAALLMLSQGAAA